MRVCVGVCALLLGRWLPCATSRPCLDKNRKNKKWQVSKIANLSNPKNNSKFHSNTKHMQLKYHLRRPVLEDGQLKLEKLHTSQNHADMLTIVVTREKLRF